MTQSTDTRKKTTEHNWNVRCLHKHAKKKLSHSKHVLLRIKVGRTHSHHENANLVPRQRNTRSSNRNLAHDRGTLETRARKHVQHSLEEIATTNAMSNAGSQHEIFGNKKGKTQALHPEAQCTRAKYHALCFRSPIAAPIAFFCREWPTIQDCMCMIRNPKHESVGNPDGTAAHTLP